MVTIKATSIKGFSLVAEHARINKHLDTVAKRTRGRLQVKVSSWKRKPTFDITTSAPFEREISTDSDVFKFQDGGTKAHKIRARPGGWLRFFWARQSRFVTTQAVNHPGTVAANWTRKAARQAETDLAKLINGGA